jgi:hypothetical protein
MEDLQLYFDSCKNILKGFSVKPFKIENYSLGYTIYYDLKDFSYNLKNGNLQFSGTYYFISYKDTERKEKKWQHKRLSAYEGSRMHFIRSLFSDSLSKENFEIYESSNQPDDSIKSLATSSLIKQNNLYSKTLFYKKPISIIHKEQSSIALI